MEQINISTKKSIMQLQKESGNVSQMGNYIAWSQENVIQK